MTSPLHRWTPLRLGVALLTISLSLSLAMLGLVGAPVAADWRPVDAPLPPDVAPRIDEVVRPLAHAPAIQAPDEPLVVEFDQQAPPMAGATVSLVPSFGAVRTPVELGTITLTGPADSGLWPGRTVQRAQLTLPADLPADLYDLVVTWGDGPAESDTQRRAVHVVQAYDVEPTVAIIADPSVGDPRPLQEGATEALPPGLPYPPDTDGDPTAPVEKVLGTTGDPTAGDSRWAAFSRAVEEINLARPDFVLIAGDLTFAAHPRALPYEMEEAWAILDRLEVPSFASPGNHDLYALDYDRYTDGSPTTGRPHTEDGRAEWQRTFGPLHYAVDIGPDFHLVSLNTYDHADMRPFPPPEFDTMSGGSVGEAQLAWLAEDLTAFRQRSPEGALVTFAHHDPSWLARRHPWPDRTNRDIVRDLLADTDVWAHFAGHTHEDRVARYHEGSIVESNGRQHLADAYPIGELHYLDRSAGDADPGTYSQAELRAMLRQPDHGPLFVTTTTAASGLIGEDWGLGGYWGWRLARLVADEDGGYDPHTFGYAADVPVEQVRAFLDATAERPERWNAEHASLGVLSYPIARFEVAPLAVAGDEVGVMLRNGLLVDHTVTVRLVASDLLPGHDLVLDGPGEITRVRRGEGVADVWVTATVPAGEETSLRLRW